MAKKDKITLSEDDIRVAILKYLYDKWKNPRGMESYKVKILKLRQALKSQDIGQKEVIRNLKYFIDTGWAKEEVEEKTISKGRLRFPSKTKTYAITSEGIDFFDGKSKFERTGKMVGINISNVSGVVNIGNNNYIRNEYVGLYNALEELGKKARISDEISDNDKISYQADISTIQSQLSKTAPDKGILKRSWETIEKLSSIGGFISFIDRIRPLIEALL